MTSKSRHALRREELVLATAGQIYFTESGTADWPDRQVQMQYWQMAVGRILVVASATIWGPNRDAPAVRKALVAVPQILESIRYT